MAFNLIHHVLSDTGTLKLDRNVSSGSNNRGRYIVMYASVASSPATGERTMIIVSSRPVIKGALSQESRVGCYHGDTHIKCVGAEKLLLFQDHLVPSAGFL